VRRALAAAVLFLAAVAARAGVLRGVVDLGAQPAGSPAIVYIDSEVEGAPPASVKPRLINRDKKLTPAVLPVVAGKPFEVSSEDDLYHNTYSVADGDSFDLFFRRKGEARDVTLAKLGRVDVACRYHRDMHAVILVVPNPYFAVTDAKGRFRIDGVPPGTYAVKAWQDKLGVAVRTVTVEKKGAAEADFRFPDAPKK
jgi:plastocyanin